MAAMPADVLRLVDRGLKADLAEELAVNAPPLSQMPPQGASERRRTAFVAVLDFVLASWPVVVNVGLDADRVGIMLAAVVEMGVAAHLIPSSVHGFLEFQ
jgi:hypothetical protein